MNKRNKLTIVPDAHPLTSQDVDKVGLTIYSRFVHRRNGPDYKSVFAEPVRQQLNVRVKEVIEALKLNGYQITRG